MSAITPFPPPIRRYLGDFVARTRRVRLVRATVVAAATFCVRSRLAEVRIPVMTFADLLRS